MVLDKLKNKPLESDGYSVPLAWCGIYALYLAATLSIGASFIRLENANQIALRLFIRLVGMGAIATAIAKTREVQHWSKYIGYREVLREDSAIAFWQQKAQEKAEQKAQKEQKSDPIEIYDWLRLLSEATGIAIFGNSGYGKSSVALWLLGLFTQNAPAKIVVCHPHAGVDRGFENRGLPPISEYPDIEKAFSGALAEFKARKARAKNREYLGEPYFLVADETDSYERNFSDPDVFQEIQTVFAKECRKYDMFLLFISHTSNVTNKKIDAQERDSFTSINVGVAALSRAEKIWGKNSTESQLLKEQAYPCLVVSSGIPYLAIHPTHGEYPEFKKTGLPPKNLMPINQIANNTPATPTPTATVQQQTATDYLQRMWAMEFDLSSNSPTTPTTQQQSATENAHICPSCGSSNSIWHSKLQGRRKCKDCGKAWTIS